MRVLITSAVFGGTVLFATASWAASAETASAGAPQPAKPAALEPVKGDALVNHGKGFEKVNSRIEVKVGDSVMVSPGGIAKVTYADGCQANVKPGSVMTIKPLSPCASGSMAADMTPLITKEQGVVEAPPPFPWVAVGILAVGGGVVGCFASGLCESGSP